MGHGEAHYAVGDPSHSRSHVPSGLATEEMVQDDPEMQVDVVDTAQRGVAEPKNLRMVSLVLGSLLEVVRTFLGDDPLVEVVVAVLRPVPVVEILNRSNLMATMTVRLTCGHLHGSLLDTWQIPLRLMLNLVVKLGEEGMLVFSPSLKCSVTGSCGSRACFFWS